MSNTFENLQKSIEKNVKGAHVSVLSQSNIATERFWVKTPCLDLNRILSGSLYKGIQSRNLVGIVGPEHSMKSSFTVLCMAEAQRQGYKAIYIDTEGGVSEEFCKRWGLDPDNMLYIYTPWIHEVKSIMGQIRDSGEEGYVIGLDSAGNLERYKALEDAIKGEPKGDQGALAKEIKGMLKLYLNICIAQNSIGIVCGHYYGRPGLIPLPDQIGGGKAMKLLPSIIISLHKKNITEGEGKAKKVVGNEIEATTLKNRVYPPFQKATIQLDYRSGVQPCAGLLDLGIEAGVITKSGSWYSTESERLGQGIVKATKALEEMKHVVDGIDDWLKDSGYSVVDEEIQKAEELIAEEAQGGDEE